jgi:acyl carrier protein
MTADRIRQIIAKEFRVEVSALKDAAHFRNHIGLSDHDLVELEIKVEKEFGIVFDGDLFEYATVGEFISTVEAKLSRKAA